MMNHDIVERLSHRKVGAMMPLYEGLEILFVELENKRIIRRRWSYFERYMKNKDLWREIQKIRQLMKTF
jgi:hypothetical protein